MVTVFLSGGLGNQLFQIARVLQSKSKSLVINISQLQSNFELEEFLKFVAQKRGLSIFIDVKKPSMLFRRAHNYLLRSGQWSKKSKTQEFVIKKSIQIAFFLSGVSSRYVSIDDESFAEHDRKNLENFYIIGYFQNQISARFLCEDLNEYLDFTYESKKSRKSLSRSSELILHVRRGDYLNEKKIGMLSNTYFKNTIREVCKTNARINLNIFTNGEINLFEMTNEIEFDSVEVIDSTSAIELLAKMRSGKIFIISNSTLSWWAAFLSSSPEKQVYAPLPWFRKLSEPKNFIPEVWVRLPAIWSQDYKK